MIWWNMNHTALFFIWVRCPCVWLPVALNATVCGSFGFKSCFLSWAFLFSFCVGSQTSVGSWMLFEDAPCCWISKSLSNTQKAQVNLKWTLLVFTLFCLPRCEYHAGPCWAWQTEEQRRGSGAVSLPPFGFLAGFLCPPPCWGHSGKKKSLNWVTAVLHTVASGHISLWEATIRRPEEKTAALVKLPPLQERWEEREVRAINH